MAPLRAAACMDVAMLPRFLTPLVTQRKQAMGHIPLNSKTESVQCRMKPRGVHALSLLIGGGGEPGPSHPRTIARSSTLADTSINNGTRNEATSSSLNVVSDSMSSSESELEARIHEAMGAEIEAAVGLAVHEAMEAEMTTVQESVAEAVGQAFEDNRSSFDLRANFNTLVALTGVVIFERGVWTAWDVYFGDSWGSELASIVVGLSIMVAIRIFNIPLAEWRRPSVGAD